MQRKLSELISFSSDGDNINRSVYYDPADKTFWIGDSASFKLLLTPTTSTILGITVLNRVLDISGLAPLIFGNICFLLITIYQFRSMNQQFVEVEPFQISQAYIDLQKKNSIKTYILIVILIAIDITLSWLYLIYSGFFLLFISILAWYAVVLLIATRQDRKSILLKQIEKDFKENNYD